MKWPFGTSEVEQPKPEVSDRAVEIIAEVHKLTHSTLNHETAAAAIGSAVAALQKQAVALSNATYEPKSYDRVARTMAYTAKMIDEMGRFLEFSKGNPDSRPDMGYADIFKGLTDEQIQIVEGWLRENASGQADLARQ